MRGLGQSLEPASLGFAVLPGTCRRCGEHALRPCAPLTDLSGWFLSLRSRVQRLPPETAGGAARRSRAESQPPREGRVPGRGLRVTEPAEIGSPYENRTRVAPLRRAAAEPRLRTAALRGSRPRTRLASYRAG